MSATNAPSTPSSASEPAEVATGAGSPLVVRASSFAQFAVTGRGKHTVHRSSALLVGVDAFEVGQEHAAHVHADQEKVWLVLEGRGTVEVGGRAAAIEAGELVVVPAGQPHALRADRGERLVVLVVLAPGPPR